MEVAVLSARLEADVAKLVRNLTAADTLLASTRKRAEELERALKEVKVPASSAAETVANVEVEKRALASLEHQALRTAAALKAAQFAFPGGVFTTPGRGLADTRASGIMGTTDPFGRQVYVPGVGTYNERGYLAGAAQAELTRLMSRTGIRTQQAFAAGEVARLVTGLWHEAEQRDERIREAVARATGSTYLSNVGDRFTTSPRLSGIRTFQDDPTMSRATEAMARGIRNETARILQGGESERTRSGIFGALFGARAAGSHAERTGSAIEREAARIFGGGGDTGFAARGLFGGILPGGRHASAAAVTSALGLLLATGPTFGPALAGAGVGAAAGTGALLGGAGTLALAFHGLSAEAFKSQKAFEALTPEQQRFVQTLRSLGAGLGETLTGIAQRTVLPGLTGGLRAAVTPASAGALTSGVGAFGGAIAGGAQQFGQLFGSSQFAQSFGAVLQADARYLRDMLSGVTNLTSAFVHLLQAAIPLTDWMDRGLLNLTKWADESVRASQASGSLAAFFDRSRQSLQAWGGLLASISNLFGAIFGAIGFQNALGTLELVSNVFKDLAGFVNANRDTIRAMFAGGLAAAEDLLAVVKTLSEALTPLLSLVNKIVGGMEGWRVVIDGILTLITVRWVAGWKVFGSAAVEQTAVVGAAVGGLRAALLGLASMAPIVIPVAIGYSQRQAAADAKAAGRDTWTPGGIGYALTHPFQDIGSVFNLFGGSPAPSTAAGALKPSPVHFATASSVGAAINAALAPALNLAAYTQSFATPDPLQGTGKAGVLPALLQRQIAQAESNVAAGGPKGPLISLLRQGIAYINRTAPGIKDNTLATTYYQERTALYSQIASLTSTTGLGILPAGMATSLEAARARAGTAAATAAVTPGGFSAAELRANQGLVAQLQHAYRYLTAELDKQGMSQKQIRAIEAERVSIARELGRTQHTVAQELVAQRLSPVLRAVARAQERLAGFGPITATTAFNAGALRAAVGLVTQLEKELEILKTIHGTEQKRATVAKEIAAAQEKVKHELMAQHLDPVYRAVARAQERMAGVGPITTTTPFSAQALRAAIGLSVQLEHELHVISQISGTEKERVRIAKELADAQRKVGLELLAQHRDEVQGRMAQILGVTGGVPGVQALRTRERQVLLGFLRRLGHVPGHGRIAGSDTELVPGASHMAIPQLIHAIQARGIDIPKSTLDSLHKINQVLNLALKEHVKLTDIVSQNVTARLSQINDTLKTVVHGHVSNYRVPTEARLLEMAGLSHLPAGKRQRLGALLAQVAEHGGKIPTGPAALGVGLSGDGNVINVTHIGHVTVEIAGGRDDARQIALAVQRELQQAGRRNPTQTRGPNAGRNRGLN